MSAARERTRIEALDEVMTTSHEQEVRRWRRWVRAWTALFMAGLVVSGLSAIPIQAEVDGLVEVARSVPALGSGQVSWLLRVQEALTVVHQRFPFLAYGTDWLAFAHFIIALAFAWAWRDPARHRWLYDYGLIACAAVLPWACVFGELRGIPWAWRVVDMSFGVSGAVLLMICRHGARRLAALESVT